MLSYAVLTLITVVLTVFKILEPKEAGYGFIIITMMLLVVYLKIRLMRESNNKRQWIIYAKDLLEQNENLRRWKQ